MPLGYKLVTCELEIFLNIFKFLKCIVFYELC